MKYLIVIPTAITSLRIAFLPLFFFLFNEGNATSCLLLFAFCVATDSVDGYLARKLNVTSKFGAYYDATTDFSFVIGIFAIFYVSGLYPVWLLLLIIAAFGQFLVTSHYAKKIYDPVGRYLGSALYIGIALTLISPVQAMFSFVQFAFMGFFLLSLTSRIISLTRKNV
ncbi:MAG: CDP-alcohol phosphatidyltransferase family protein [Candidatus Bathyarchaeota archaeon]|nr:CDP-alcohol phosphatidyltransferase family protein [Candidatus Bathyarchaeota archaeon]